MYFHSLTLLHETSVNSVARVSLSSFASCMMPLLVSLLAFSPVAQRLIVWFLLDFFGYSINFPYASIEVIWKTILSDRHER